MNIYTVFALIVFGIYLIFIGCRILMNYWKRRKFRKFVENMQIPF